MTDNRCRTGASRQLGWLALLLTGALLQGCGQKPEARVSRYRVFAADFAGGAKSCDVPKITPTAGQSTEVSMKLGNDGGWCGLPVYQAGPMPYDAGLLTARPAHGTVLIHGVGEETRIDYTPDRGYSGTDTFAVKLIPGDATLQVAALVNAPAPAGASTAAK